MSYTEKNVCAKRCDREHWGIVLKFEGETVYTSCGKQYVSDINHPVILPMGCTYEWECRRAGHFAIIEFDCPVRCEEIIRFSVKNGEKLLDMIRDLEYKRTLTPGVPMIESIRDTYSILLAMIGGEQKRYVSGQNMQKLTPAIEYIAKNYSTAIKNDDLAAVTGLSNVYFRKLFTAVMGTSPMEYVRNVRLQKAKEMLSSDHGSITEVATSLGYQSIYDFSRAFKKHTGMSPKAYKEKK